MNEYNLKLAQKDIDDALNTIEDIQKELNGAPVSKDAVKEKFSILSGKMQQIENILKEEGIIE